MAEWLKAAVLKTVSGVTRSGVRIPLPPPDLSLLLPNLWMDIDPSLWRDCVPSVAQTVGRGQSSTGCGNTATTRHREWSSTLTGLIN